MTFTYDETDLSSPIAQVRLEIGDTDPAAPYFSDEEIRLKLDENGDAVMGTAADLCDILATRLAGQYDFKWMDQSFSRSQASRAYADRAKVLRTRAQGGDRLGVQQTRTRYPIRLDDCDGGYLDDETILLRDREEYC